MLFENEKFVLKEIYNVVLYAPKDREFYRFKGKLYSYELLYYTAGDAVLSFGGKSFEVKKGSIIYLPKGIDTDYNVKVKEDFTVYNIYFDTDSPMPDYPISFTPEKEELKQIYAEMYRLWLTKNNGYYYKISRLFFSLAEILIRYQKNTSAKDRFSRLSLSEKYLNSHYCDYDFDYGELISLSGLSYSYFKKLFLEKYGIPPVKYITALKIRRAKELLETERYKISEIAELCGFENIYYFSNLFKKNTGYSPSEYLKQIKK